MNHVKALVWGLVAVGLFPAGCVEPNSCTQRVPDAVNLPAHDLAGSDPAAVKLPDLQKKAELPDLLAYAALNNPGLESAFNRWKAALQRVPQVKSLPDPQFTYQYFIEEVEATRSGPQRQRFGISQMFPWFGKPELQGDAASEAANAEYQRYEAAKLQLFYQVKDAYYEYYYLWRAIAIEQENIKLLKRVESVARTRYEVTVGGYPDLIRIQVELGKLDNDLRSLQYMREPMVAKLNASLNRPTTEPIAWPDKLQEEKISVTDEQLLNLLERTNPELKAMEFETAERKLEIALAKKNYFPDVMIGLDYDNVVSTGGMDNEKDMVMAMVSINLPIWWNKLSAGVRRWR